MDRIARILLIFIVYVFHFEISRVVHFIVIINDQTYPALVYSRPAAGAKPTDLTYTTRKSSDATNWTTGGIVETVSPIGADGRETVTARSTVAITVQGRQYFQLQVALTVP